MSPSLAAFSQYCSVPAPGVTLITARRRVTCEEIDAFTSGGRTSKSVSGPASTAEAPLALGHSRTAGQRIRRLNRPRGRLAARGRTAATWLV